MIEKIARSMCAEMDGKLRCMFCSSETGKKTCEGKAYKYYAKAAIQAITDAGMVIVPREPTEGMKVAAGQWWSEYKIYQAMIKDFEEEENAT